MSSTKVKKLPFQSKELYDYDWNRPIKDKSKFFKKFIPLADFLLHKEFESIEIIGADNVPKGGKLILASNHVNGFDPITIMYGMNAKRSAYFMAKEEFFQAFYTRWALFIFNGFPVKRDTADKAAMKYAEKIINAEQMLIIFPQGSRDRYRTEPTPEGVKTGFAMLARDTHADVIPVSIHLSSDLNNHHPKCVIRYGEVIPYEDLGFTEGVRKSREVKEASKLIMTKVQDLWNQDQM